MYALEQAMEDPANAKRYRDFIIALMGAVEQVDRGIVLVLVDVDHESSLYPLWPLRSLPA